MLLPGFLVSVIQLAAVGVSLEALRQGAQTSIDPQKARQRMQLLKDHSREQDRAIDELNEQLKENDSKIIPAKVGRAYSPAVRLMCMRFVDFKVSFEKIPHVITAVLLMAGFQLSEVLNERTVWRIAGAEALALAHAQVAQQMTECSGNFTLQMDETSKFGQQYLATTVRTDNGETFVLGLNEMANKSAQPMLAIFKEKLADLDAVKGKEGTANLLLL
uniref:Uncharacterized protein n=1 Tax=Plectus sambesii TaxID=2011161 RepID=A0A914V799_9BILA